MLYIIITIWAVGLLGNLLSAIVWLRQLFATKNSLTVYLLALAINDVAHLLTLAALAFFSSVSQESIPPKTLFQSTISVLSEASFTLEPLLVLGFSVERLIAILYPLQVRIRFARTFA